MRQKEQLQIEIETLTATKEDLGQRLETANETTTWYKINNELLSVTEQLRIKREELEKIESAAGTAIEAITSELEAINIGGEILSLTDFCQTEEHAQLLSLWLKTRDVQKAEAQAVLEASYQSEIAAQKAAILELEVHRKESIHLSELLADMTARRDAAGEELLHANEEIARLTKDNESLRKQFETKPTTNTPQIDAAEIIRKIQAAKPGIYNKRWKISERGLEDRRYFTANLSETGEELHIPILDIGKYREETADEAARFRAEMAQKEMEKLVQETIDHVEAPPYRKRMPNYQPSPLIEKWMRKSWTS